MWRIFLNGRKIKCTDMHGGWTMIIFFFCFVYFPNIFFPPLFAFAFASFSSTRNISPCMHGYILKRSGNEKVLIRWNGACTFFKVRCQKFQWNFNEPFRSTLLINEITLVRLVYVRGTSFSKKAFNENRINDIVERINDVVESREIATNE